MSTPIEFYLQQAALCGQAADAADLPNQRSKFLRSQQAWQEMADRRAAVLAGRAKETKQ